MSHEKGLEAAKIAYTSEDGRVNPYALRSAIEAYLAATKPTGEVGEVIERLRETPTERSWDSVGRPYDYPKDLPKRAADLLERLAEEVAYLKRNYFGDRGSAL